MTKQKAYSLRWMTYQEVAEHFRVSEATVRLGRGVFGKLRRVNLCARRTVVLRADVEKLDREMERGRVAYVERYMTREATLIFERRPQLSALSPFTRARLSETYGDTSRK